MLASMLTTPDENQGTGSSIGSSLQMLELSGNFAGFCYTLAANASRIRLPCLRLPPYHRHQHSTTNADWEALNMCLPKLVYLKKLDIPDVDENVSFRNFVDALNVSFRNFVDALRRNGSLQHVVVCRAVVRQARDCVFNEVELCLIQSYCKRNEAIPILVAKVRLDKGNDDDKTDLSLLPTLFQTAKEAPRTAPNIILMGLLAAGCSIGPR